MADATVFVCQIACFPHQNMVLDLPNGNQANGQPLQLYQSIPSNPNQEWLFEPIEDGYYVIRLAANPDKVLHADSPINEYENNMNIFDRLDQDPNQEWTLYFLNGVFAIINRSVANHGLWHELIATPNGDRIMCYRYWHQTNQQNGLHWVLRFVESPLALGLTSASDFVLEFCPNIRPGTPRNTVEVICKTVEMIQDLQSGPSGILQAVETIFASDVIPPDPGEPGGPELYTDPSTLGDYPDTFDLHDRDRPREHHCLNTNRMNEQPIPPS